LGFIQKSLIFLLGLTVLLNLTYAASAYNPQYADDSKTVRLRWKSGVIPISISNSFYKQTSSIRPDSDVAGAFKRSLETWESVANIKFVEVSSDKQSVSPAGKNGDGISLITIAQTPENLLLFGSDSEEISARTRVFYDSKGFISEADIVLNPYQQFSTDGSIGTFDLEATLTHEIGHLLGLDHSTVIGATMQTSQGKNGIYNLPGFTSRTLAEDDIAGIRSIYGTKEAEDYCCGSAVGKLSLPNNKPAAGFQVWLEDVYDGRVIAGVLTNSDGEFLIEGLPIGEYRVYAKNVSKKDAKPNFSAIELETVKILKDKKVSLTEKLIENTKEFELQYVGFNGQLSELPVPVNAGKSYMIYLGGKNLDSKDLVIEFSSPHIKVTPNSIIKHDYGKDISVISFEVKLSIQTPLGEYSFFVKKKDSQTDVSIGSLTVESFVNNWNSYFISEN
jgi:hypothetical protein